MTIYHKLIHGNMLNNYELGDISQEEALAQGYKPLIRAERPDNRLYGISYEEDETSIREILGDAIEEVILPIETEERREDDITD